MDRGRPGVEEQAGGAADEGCPLVLEGRRFRGTDAAEDPSFEHGEDRGTVFRPEVGPDALLVLGDPGLGVGIHGCQSVQVRHFSAARSYRNELRSKALSRRPDRAVRTVAAPAARGGPEPPTARRRGWPRARDRTSRPSSGGPRPAHSGSRHRRSGVR